MDPILNFAKSNVNQGYDDSAVEIALVTGGGAKFPSPATDGAFNLVWYNSSDYGDPADDPNVEIVRCTARSTDTLTITRAQESTSASTKNTADKTYIVVLAPTEKTMDDVLARTNHTGVQAGTTVELTDAGDYYTGTETEAALQEVGLALTGKAAIAQTFYIGTTQVAINRASAALTLAGLTLTTPNLGTPSALIGTNISGTGSSFTAGAVSNATFTTALTVNTGTLTLTADGGNDSVLTIGGGAVSVSGTNTGDNTVATALTGTPSITVANIVTTGTIDLGHADDTTIARASAGVVSIQGSDILVSGGALGTPSGGTLTNCTGLPVSGLANGTDGELITWAADASATTVAAGTADQVLTSNGAGAAPTFQDAVGDINEETGTTYTLVLGDAPRGTVRCTNVAAITLTVPKNSSVAFPTGTTIAIVQGGAGQVTIAPVDGDVTLESYENAYKLVGQYAGAVLIKRDTDTWILEGNLEA